MSLGSPNEDAERVTTIGLNRWKLESEPPGTFDHAGLSAVLTDDIGYLLLAFRLDDVERRPIFEYQAELPITDYFVVTATLAVVPRSPEPTLLDDARAYVDASEILTRKYNVKHFSDGTWVVMCRRED